MAKKNDLSHLTKECKKIAKMSDEERITWLKTDKWIGYSRAKNALSRLEDLISLPCKQRMPNALLIGPTNNGKSMLIEKFKRGHPSFEVQENFHETRMPVVAMQMPPDPSMVRFYSMLISSTGAPVRAGRAAELEQMALNRMKSVEARMLVIDELHNVLAGQANVRNEFLNLLRFLGNELRIPIVGVGIREAYLAIRSDDQLENRFEPISLPKWKEGDELLSLLASFEAVLPLWRKSNLASADVARYILACSEGTIGEISRFLVAAAITAIESGEERISSKVLKRTSYQSPTERRRTFERHLQAG
jgi:hypothetical protein